MPRDLPLGNGDYLVTFDSRYQLRDIYYPNVGQENHTVGDPSRFGLWVDGTFAWTGDDGWDRHITYEHETLVGDTTLVHPKLGLSLRFRDAVDFDRNIYFKEVTVEDAIGRERQVRFFQHFDAHLYGNDTGDSAYYDPRSQAVVHYKGRRYFLISGSSGGSAYGLSSFAIGQKDAPGKEGTWRDAEDGELSRNPVAQGSIDSVGMVAVTVPARGTATAVFWIAAGQAYEDVRELDKLVRERTPASFLARTKDYWRLWANKDESITEHLPDEINGLYKRSTLVIRTQVDNRGAIIAANDSDVLRFNRDTYSYLWPRDGALVADALDLAGYGEVTRRFFFLCGELITREGYLLHKYNSSSRYRKMRPVYRYGRSGSTTTATATSSSSARSTASLCEPAPISWRRIASPAPSCPLRRSTCGRSVVESTPSRRRLSGPGSPPHETSQSRSASMSSQNATRSLPRRSATPRSSISGTRTGAASCVRSACFPTERS